MTREALVREGSRLFFERGYEATTLDDICAAVKVSIRTLLRYFNTKEQLALAVHYQALEEFRRSIADRHDGVTVLAFWRDYVARYSRLSQRDPDMLRRRRLIEAVPSLHAHWLLILREYEDLLTEALIEEAASDADSDLESRLTAVLLVWGNEACARRWSTDTRRLDLEQMCLEVVATASERFGRRRPSRTRAKPATAGG
jgi:AcrR family transcriptional regulator